MDEQLGLRGVHLFLDSVLIANLKTVDQTPEETYKVDGIRYDVASYVASYGGHHRKRHRPGLRRPGPARHRRSLVW